VTDYREIVERLEANERFSFEDGEKIMALLGYEAREHKSWGLACRPFSGGAWQTAPRFNSADDFELWVLRKFGGDLCDAGSNDDGTRYVSYEHKDYGNDYGNAKRLGTAMWAAFVRLIGRVDDDT
jgi:hypothetical protein